MTDYAASPAQPILQGLVTVFVPEVGVATATFFGKGALPTVIVNGVGDYTLVLDRGLPGDVAIDPAFARTQLTIRAGIAGIPTTVISKAVSYLVNAIPGVGADRIRIQFADVGSDPIDASFEIIVRRGNAGIDAPNVQMVGPLFQP